jgi:large subunit ribosomal protein L11
MSKAVKAKVKLQLIAGSANPAPPVGSMLGPHGINLMKFCTEFNNSTKSASGSVVPVIITVFSDKSFTLEYKTTPVSNLLKKHAKIEKGSKQVGKEIVGKISKSQAIEIAKIKMPDLNTTDLDAACKIIEGSARSMGIDVIED